jgi:hypothetical protein
MFGGKLFCTPEYQTDKLCNNQWILLRQNVVDANDCEYMALFAGHIQGMMTHRLRRTDEPVYIINCNWYEAECSSWSSKLTKVRYKKWDDPYQFLDVCEPANVVCWPADPFNFDWDNERMEYKNPDNVFNIIRKEESC